MGSPQRCRRVVRLVMVTWRRPMSEPDHFRTRLRAVELVDQRGAALQDTALVDIALVRGFASTDGSWRVQDAERRHAVRVAAVAAVVGLQAIQQACSDDRIGGS